jgi:hypothetical protein
MNELAEAFTEKPIPEFAQESSAAIADSPDLDTDMLTMLSEYAELSNRLRDAQGEADMLKSKMSELEPSILEAMALNGVDNVRVKNLTVYRKTNFYVSKRGSVETQTVCDLLREHGLGYLVADGYSPAALKSKVKEWLDEGAEVPAKLAECLNVGDQVVLATRK